MKKIQLTAVAVLLLAASTFAQQGPKAYINGFGGYTFDESFWGYYGEWKYKGNAHYGGSAEYVLQGASTRYNERTIELLYQGMSSDLVPYFAPGANKPVNANLTVSYLTLGANNYIGKSRKVMGFGGIAMGAAFFNGSATVNSQEYSDSETKFAINLKGGGRFMFSDNVGLKLYAQLNTVVGGVGGGFYFGTGGISTGVSTYSSMVQFGLGGGLTIGLGGSKPSGSN
ncbi:MAG: hypothetical protein MUF29_07395 [Chitinophagaceae bacterium]|nr:hypothetical protein [Chitinophagaceae bacterium]